MISIIEFSGTESDAVIKQLAWRMFCDAHPHEAHEQDPEAFFNYIKSWAPHVTREQVERIIKET